MEEGGGAGGGRGAGGGLKEGGGLEEGGGSQREKGQPVCPEAGRLRAAVRIGDPHPVAATSSFTRGTNQGQRRGLGVDGYHPSVAPSGREREMRERQHGQKDQC